MLFDQIKHVAIETNNRCNYSHLHKKCPANSVKHTIVLPQKYIFDIINTLGNNNYRNAISFFHYNESLIEPRLFMFIKYTREHCPQSKIFIGTNGLMLTEDLALELYDAGVACILISTYTQSEKERMDNLKLKLSENLSNLSIKGKSFSIRHRDKLDDRLLIQDTLHKFPKNKSTCSAPLAEVIIRSNGEMPLCCMDIDCQFSYGNIEKKKFADILINSYDKMLTIKSELRKGIRNHEICKNCFFARRWRVDHMCTWFNAGKLNG